MYPKGSCNFQIYVHRYWRGCFSLVQAFRPFKRELKTQQSTFQFGGSPRPRYKFTRQVGRKVCNHMAGRSRSRTQPPRSCFCRVSACAQDRSRSFGDCRRTFVACIHPLDTPSLSFCGPWVPSSYKRRVLSGRLVHSRQYPTPTRSTISHGPSDEPSLSKVRRPSCPRSQICLFLSSPLFSQLKALDHDIRVALATLRRHINPLDSPIYHLPPDLFPEIASHLTKETDLVDATHVSYHLRNTLLSHPSLWSHLKFDRETRAWAFLERSGQTPLHIDIPKNTIRTAGSFIKLCRQSDRIASLNLQHWWVQKKFLSQSLPSLRRLKVFYDYYDHDWNESLGTSVGPAYRADVVVSSLSNLAHCR